MPEPAPVALDLCDCPDRTACTQAGLFRFIAKRDGWVLTLEPWCTWVECPWCDRLLPSTSCVKEALDAERRRADGEGPEAA